MTSSTPERTARYRAGLRAEWIAASILRLRGYRILDRRWKSTAGEIDIVAKRGHRLAFVEVKQRPDTTDEEAHAAVGPAQRARIRSAAELWIARHRAYAGLDRGFDVVLIAPRRWPRIIWNGL